MKRRLCIGIGIAVFVLGVVSAPLLIPVVPIIWQIKRAEAAVTNSAACEAAAKPLARLCQSDPFFFRDEPHLAPAWTPAGILKLHPTWVEIRPDSARVEFGGGFHHFGYALSRDTATDTATQNGWKLDFYSEDSSNRLLKAFTLDKSDHIDTRTFIDQAMAEFRRRATAGAGDRAVRERLVFLLKFDEIELARKSIREYAAAVATDWPDQLLAFVIDHKVNPSVSKQLESWAAGMGDSSAWLLAAYACGLVGDDDGLERSAKLSLSKPLDEPNWLQYNVRFRATAVCQQLCQARRYATCAALCDAALAQSKDTFLAGELGELRKLALRTRPTDPPPPIPDIPEGMLFEPFKGIDLSRLTVTPGRAPVVQTLPSDPQARMIHYLSAQIASDRQSRRRWAAKFEYLWSVDRRDEALATYKEAITAVPDWWRPRFALAMLGDRASRSKANAAFAAWVEEHPAFIHWCYLSRLYRDSGQDAEALDAIRQAVKYPLEAVDDDEPLMPHAFAFDAATFACRHKQYDLTLQITAVWSKPKGAYNYFDDDIYAFRAAAELGQGKFAEAQADADKVVAIAKGRGLWAQNLDALQKAAVAKDANFQYDADPGNTIANFSLFRD